MALIRLERIKKQIDGFSILKNISFEVNKGDIFGIIGRNGAGKTTLLRVLIGFYHYDDGNYLIYDDPKIPLNKEFLKSNIGFATQENCFYDDLTVQENVKYFGKMYFIDRYSISSKIETVLKEVELYEQRNVLAKNLSGGMKRRLDLACALIHDPHILILDEPTAELDPVAASHMWKTLKRINKRGTTIILSSHFLNKVDHVCNRVGIIDQGYILETGTPKELKEKYSKNEEIVIQTFPANYDVILERLKLAGVNITNAIIRDKHLVIYTRYADKLLYLMLRIIQMLGERIIELEVNKPSLNEVFESVTNKQAHNSRLKNVIDREVEDFKRTQLKKKLEGVFPDEELNEELR